LQESWFIVPKNRLKEMIAKGQPAVGSWIGLTDISAAEAMAGAGFDWLLIDTEHSPIGRETLRNILIACNGYPAVPVVRLTSNSPDHFKIALDLGAQGIVVPFIQSGADAKHAVDYCRYPPQGARGVGPFRASNYYRQFDEYVREANDEILLVAQIESLQGVKNLNSILSVGGIDGIFIGPSDLAASMNAQGPSQHAEVEQVVNQISSTAREVGVPFGLPVWTPEEFANYASIGATLMTLGGDLRFLMDRASDYLGQVRALLPAEKLLGSDPDPGADNA
jgi:4-hydroxy-2-oxoheptanedioate aldolase